MFFIYEKQQDENSNTFKNVKIKKVGGWVDGWIYGSKTCSNGLFIEVQKLNCSFKLVQQGNLPHWFSDLATFS
jgi:hypothetical protein